MLIRIPRGWEIPERLAAPEDVYLNRRKFLKTLGITGLGAIGAIAGCDRWAGSQSQSAAEAPPPLLGLPTPSATANSYPAKRNDRFVLDRPLTDEAVAGRYNNFYEFSFNKQRVCRLV